MNSVNQALFLLPLLGTRLHATTHVPQQSTCTTSKQCAMLMTWYYYNSFQFPHSSVASSIPEHVGTGVSKQTYLSLTVVIAISYQPTTMYLLPSCGPVWLPLRIHCPPILILALSSFSIVVERVDLAALLCSFSSV